MKRAGYDARTKRFRIVDVFHDHWNDWNTLERSQIVGLPGQLGNSVILWYGVICAKVR